MQRQQVVDLDMLLQGKTLDVFHGQIGVVIFDDAFVNLGDIGVIEAPGDHAFVLEQFAQAARHGRAILAETNELDGDGGIGIGAHAQVDRRRRALAKLLDHPVFAYRLHALRNIPVELLS